MSELTPITRIEEYLDAIVNSGTPPLEDITRIETFLQAIYDNQVCALTPITRIEMFLGKISGQDIELPQPITRAELYLAAIAGEEVELPENPITRLEMYLAEWADSGDWTTISGAIVEFITQRAHKLKSCVVSLSPQQDLHGQDAPWPAGGGKNLMPVTVESSTVNGITYTVQKDNAGNVVGVHCSGTASIASFLVLNDSIPLVAGQSYRAYSGLYTGSDWGTYALQVIKGIESATVVTTGATGRSGDFVAESGGLYRTRIYVWAGQTVDATFKPMVCEDGVTDTSFAPYENICPISGYTGVEASIADEFEYRLPNSAKTEGGLTITTTDGNIATVVGTATITDGVAVTTFVATDTNLVVSDVASAEGLPFTWFLWDATARKVISGQLKDLNGEYMLTVGHTYSVAMYVLTGTDYDIKTRISLTHSQPTTYSVTFGALGKNLFNPAIFRAGNLDNPTQFPSVNVCTDGYIEVDGGKSYAWSQTTYPDGSFGRYPRWYDADKNLIASGTSYYAKETVVMTAPEKAKFVRLMWYKSNQYTSMEEFLSDKPQLEQGSSATAYEPYRDQVYGGNYDFVNGKGKDGMATLKTSEITWQGISQLNDGTGYEVYRADVFPSVPTTCISDAFKKNARGDAWENLHFGEFRATRYLIVTVPNEANTLALAQAYLDNLDAEFVYSVTPVETDITPTPVSTLKGYNAMWSNAGDIEVTVHGTPVEVETLQALNLLLGGAYRNNQTPDDVSDEEALDILIGGNDR